MDELKGQLITLYHIENKTMSQIGNLLGADRKHISRLFNKYGIDKKSYRSAVPAPPKEELLNYYDTEMKTIKDICDIYGVGKRAVKKWLNMYGIKIIPNSQKKFHNVRKIPFNKMQRSLVIGSLLGDGCLSNSGKFKRLCVAHSKKQLPYLLWKKEIMGDFVPRIIEYIDKKYKVEMASFYSVGHQELNPIYKLFYHNNKKVVDEKLAYYLDDLAMAIWFMDDGSSKKDKKGITYCSKISSEGFTKKENEALQHIIKANFGIRCKVCEYNRYDKKYYYLSFNKKNSVLLTRMIENYVVDCMKYKLVYDRSPTTNMPNTQKSEGEDIV